MNINDRTNELSTVDKYYAIKTTELDTELRGTNKNFMVITLNKGEDEMSKEDLNIFAKVILDKKLKDIGISGGGAVFMPADNVEYVNTYGKPMYVFSYEKGGCHHYEFETHIGRVKDVSGGIVGIVGFK